MKINNWRRGVAAALMAAGVWIPDITYAANIPLADPGFEAFTVPVAGYAYANTYRPTSGWVDDLNSPPGYTQDDAASNWLYNAAYAEGTTRQRPSPRTGDQALHGFAHYSAQTTSAVFEANTTYTFSIWAQGDSDADGASSRVWLYLYDGSLPFSEANSLIVNRYAPDTGDFLNRAAGITAAESQSLWRQISLSHTVLPGAAEIGQPVGVAFWSAVDNALDDAALASALIPEPTGVVLVGMAGLTLWGVRRRE